ncbi:hypothetical protein [Nocardiopsis coralliicola]
MGRSRTAAAAAVFGAVAVLGVPAGVAWWVLAPRTEVTVIAGGQVVPFPVTEATFAMQGTYALIAAAAGMLTGYCAYLVQYRLARSAARQYPGGPVPDMRLACLTGLVLGAIAGALLAWGTGSVLEGGSFERAVAAADPGDTVTDRLHLDALGALVVWPFVAVLQYGLFDAVSLWRRDTPTDQLQAAVHPHTPGPAPSAEPDTVSPGPAPLPGTDPAPHTGTGDSPPPSGTTR